DGRRPIHIAAQYGDLTIIKLIVNAGSPLNVIDNMGSTPLHLTLEAGYDDAAMYFVKEGLFSTINRPFKYHMGESPIHMAAQLGMDRVLDCMLKRGGNPNLQEKTGLTPLHMAVQYRHCTYNRINVMKILLSYGADPNICDKNLKSPLHKVQVCQIACSQLLLEAGAKVNACDNRGCSVLDECIFSYGMTKDQSYLMAILPTLVQAGLTLRPPSRGFVCFSFK
ncbi:hypothetical protein HELRODRAFT_63798, partial [Helobdella robusta]|uniref:Uncharacterized protein n=1 Tax=Helobdella robusta TaxID=6412 RepID=T1FXK4_HELRO